MTTTKLIAWATTAETMPGADPGVGVQATTVDEDGVTIEYGEVVTSDAQPTEWGITPGGWFDGDAADDLLESMGYSRCEPWTESGGQYAAHVERA